MRAKPIFSLTLVAAALALPGAAAALGLGKLTVQSSLGQPLTAYIELTSVAKEELDSVSARVADPSLYRQNNLAYQGVLSRARVSLERLPNGDGVLKVTTPTGIAEPYLDLLVEVNWASGRVVRAYTFLLDPPGVPAASPVEPVTPRAGAGSTRATLAPAPVPAAAAPERAPAEAKSAPGGGYSVRRGDTLSKIASDYKPPSATLEQMLVALFATNKNAFEGNNMNRLRAGSILTIPTPDEVTATPAPDASKTVRVQAADWRAYQDQVAGAAPAAGGQAGRGASGKIGTTVEEKTPAVVPGRDQLRVSPEVAQGKGAPVTPAEEVISRDKALREAQTRISELEKTLKDLQRMIELKNQTGAQLQAQADAAKGNAGEAAKAAPVAPTVAPATTPTPPPATAPVGEAPKAVIPPPKAVEPAKPAEPPKAVETPAKAPEPAKAPAAPKSDGTKIAPKPEVSFIDEIISNTPLMVIGLGALALLGGVFALIAVRRRKTVKFEDSIIGGSDIKTNTVFGSTGGGVVNTGENSLATDFSREGLGNIDTDEVDPIAEAEVYLAYGRDAQAEEILKDALRKDAQRQEIYLKLLEIHAQHNKPAAFETVAAELYSVSNGQGDIWQKAVTLGRQLDPNNPMFGEGAAAAAAAAAAATGGEPKTAFAHESHQDAAARGVDSALSSAKTTESEKALDFRFDEDVSVQHTTATTKAQLDMIDAAEREFEETAKRGPSLRSVSDNLGDVGKAAAVGAAAYSAKSFGASEHEQGPPSIDFQFHLDDEDKPAPLQKSAARSDTVESDNAKALARPQAAVDLDKLDLAFDPEQQPFEDPTPSVLDGQWHDAATKLDLAKAYQEMGDVEGAREILQEVLHEGDAQQKAEAQSLLAKLS